MNIIRYIHYLYAHCLHTLSYREWHQIEQDRNLWIEAAKKIKHETSRQTLTRVFRENSQDHLAQVYKHIVAN